MRSYLGVVECEGLQKDLVPITTKNMNNREYFREDLLSTKQKIKNDKLYEQKA